MLWRDCLRSCERPCVLELISKMRLSPHGGVAGRLPAFGGTHILPCMLRFLAAPRLALNPDSHS
jgi:hypothetical protein